MRIISFLFCAILSSTFRLTQPQSFSNTLKPKIVQKGLVTVYHKKDCPHCQKVFHLLEKEYALKVAKVDISGEDGQKKINQMRTFSGGRNTVPQVFFNSEHLGGNDDVQALHSEGKLKELVESILSQETKINGDWYHPWY
mmetsp:Transcript_7101/g.10619  ORF Transcript_7101/g.10619 Transcript_7101/m.10619 type:complete len:140 (-) Transcript_7101:123-542(-)